MQVITHWPKPDELFVPPIVQFAIYEQLIEPFETEQLAKEFWAECPCTIVVLAEELQLSKLSQELSRQIEFSLNNVEFEEVLPDGYKITLSIFSDDGRGCYLVYPPKFSRICEGG